MIAVRQLPKPLLILLALLLGFALAVPLMGAKGGGGTGGKGGNSAIAKACDKDGWMTLATAEDPYTAFTSKDACVAYGAETGTAPVTLLVRDPALESACAILGGVVEYRASGRYAWSCLSNPYPGTPGIEAYNAGRNLLLPYCPSGRINGVLTYEPPSIAWLCERS